MRAKILAAFILILLMMGCATSRYRQAEKAVEKNEYQEAVRYYLQLLDPHVRNGKHYIYYDKELLLTKN